MAKKPSSDRMRLAVLGTGRLGSVLAEALHRAGWPVVALWNRSPHPARRLRRRLGAGRAYREASRAAASAQAVFLTVSDDAVSPLAEVLAAGRMEGKIVFHTSGVFAAAALSPLDRVGARTGALHPLQTFADPTSGLKRLPGTCWAADGHAEALALARQVVRSLEGRLLAVPAEGRVLYHAAAVVASNYLVALAEVACRLMAASGVPEGEALGALLPLMEGTLSNLRGQAPAHALTGPVARGDAVTVARHLKAMEPGMPGEARLYRALGRRCVGLAEQRGLDPRRVRALRKALSGSRGFPAQP